MSKNKKIWITAGVSVVVLIAVVLVVIAIRNQNSSSTSVANFQTTTVQRGTLTSTVEGTGTVASTQSVALSWLASGQVDQVNSQIGDQVKAGDILGTLLLSSLTQSSLESNLVTAQENLAEMTSPSAIASAQAAVASNEQALIKAQYSRDSLNVHNQGAVTNALAGVTLAKSNLDNAQSNYDRYVNLPDTDTSKALAYQGLYGAQQRYNTALYTYNILSGHASQITIASADAALALAKANLEESKTYLAALTGEVVPANATGTSLLKLNQARLAVETAQSNLDAAKLSAPFDGTVTQENAIQDAVVSTGSQAFRIDNLSSLVVAVQVTEIDINGIKAGQPATITFDAIPNKSYIGKVVKSDLAGTVGQNSVNFTVTVQVIDTDALIKPGMAANVTITTNQVENALLIPSTSIFTDTSGQQYVYLIQNGVSTTVPVTVGAVSDTTSQVTNDTLKEGDTIVLSFASTTSSSGGGFGLGGLGGIGGGDSVRVQPAGNP
jgi:HlyD family secretion protein